MEKILVGLSGGVDSSVAALLLKEQGYQVAGAYIRVWMEETDVFGRCPASQDIEDARAVARQLGIDFEVVNLIDAYRRHVVDYLIDGYRRGITPNPDVLCNREMKFGIFRDWAKQQGFDAVGTGHYVRRRDLTDGTAAILEGLDPNKDQSYFLALLNQEQIRDARFPLGDLKKPQVRALAREHGFPNAEKRDSQGICFLGKVRIQDFLDEYIGRHPGPIVNHRGETVGEHQGLHRFTIGQRKGIGVPSNTDHEAYVVVGKDYDTQTLLVAFDQPDAPGLYQQAMTVGNLHWCGQPLTDPADLLARPRYRDPSVPARFEPATENRPARVVFNEPQRALATGQVVAFYEGERLLGGGFYH